MDLQDFTDDGKELPPFGLVLGVILIPLVLILLSTLSKYMPLPAGVKDVLGFIGKPFLALTIATLASMYFLGIRRGFSGAQLKKILDHSLRPVGMILLVIASGGVIRWMLQDSGLGNIIGPVLEKSGLPLILIAFLIALLVRASVGSSIVAMTMASGIMATMPAVMDTSMLYRAAMTRSRRRGRREIKENIGEFKTHQKIKENGGEDHAVKKSGNEKISAGT